LLFTERIIVSGKRKTRDIVDIPRFSFELKILLIVIIIVSIHEFLAMLRNSAMENR